jgi:signal recognition particle GTPase
VEAFQAAVPLTGLIMTKLDGTAKGGILVCASPIVSNCPSISSA